MCCVDSTRSAVGKPDEALLAFLRTREVGNDNENFQHVSCGLSFNGNRDVCGQPETAPSPRWLGLDFAVPGAVAPRNRRVAPMCEARSAEPTTRPMAIRMIS
jgi:hypothetical protein